MITIRLWFADRRRRHIAFGNNSGVWHIVGHVAYFRARLPLDTPLIDPYYF